MALKKAASKWEIEIDILAGGGIIPCRIIPRNLSPNYLALVDQHRRHIVCLGDTTSLLPPENRQISPTPEAKMLFRIYIEGLKENICATKKQQLLLDKRLSLSLSLFLKQLFRS